MKLKNGKLKCGMKHQEEAERKEQFILKASYSRTEMKELILKIAKVLKNMA
jgi:hypothetical protein